MSNNITKGKLSTENHQCDLFSPGAPVKATPTAAAPGSLVDFARAVGFVTIQRVQIWSCTYCCGGFNDRSKSWNSVLSMMLIIWQRSRDLFIINSSPYKHKPSPVRAVAPHPALLQITFACCFLHHHYSQSFICLSREWWTATDNAQGFEVWTLKHVGRIEMMDLWILPQRSRL